MNSFPNSVATQIQAEILACEEESPRHFRLMLRAPSIVAHACAGQFIHVLPRGAASSDPFLRRAFSIMAVSHDEVEILFRVGGRGTALLAAHRAGQNLDILGPLGQPFDISMFHVKQSRIPTPILVGGGIGVPPLLFLARTLQEAGAMPQVLIGARSAGEVVIEERFEALGIVPQIATDDGSRGYHGRVTSLLETALQSVAENGDAIQNEAIIYACGPAPMLKAVAAVAAGAGARCQVSMEENMPCGIGVCNGCVVAMRDAATDYERFQRVCVAGPALWASDIDWERF